MDTISRRLFQFGLLSLALFVPFSIAGANFAIGFGILAWVIYGRSRHGRLYERLGREGDIDARHDPFLLFSLILVLSALPSVIMSESLNRAIVDWRSYWLLVVHFLVAAHVARVRVRSAAFWVLFASTTTACLVAFVQRAGGLDLGFVRIEGVHRVGGTLYTMTFAGILYQLIIFNFAVALSRDVSARAKVLLGAGIVVQFITILLTVTRGAWIALAAGLVTACFLIRNRAVAVIATVFVAGMLIFSYVYSNDQGRSISVTELFRSGPDQNVATRLVLWDIAWDLFTEHPVAGVGLGDYEIEADRMLGDRRVTTTVDSHNAYLQILATRGLIGFVPFVLFWVILLWQLFRARNRYERGSLEWSYAVGAIGVTVAVMFGALTELNIDDEEVFIAFMFLTGFARSVMYTPTPPRGGASG